MLLSDAEREGLVEVLSRHAAQGRLDVAELERRVAVVYRAKSRQDVAAVIADLPPLADTGPAPPRRPRRGGGHGDAETPAPDWRATNERFRDPRSGRVMRVWVDPSGGRHYVAEASA